MKPKSISPCAGLALLLSFFTGGACLQAQGPLDPPPGPPGDTMKTLTEVEPRTALNLDNTPGDNDDTPSLLKITRPGSYYLTANVDGVAAKHGIEIAASNVTLDLNGFAVIGVKSSLDGIVITSVGVSDVLVKNGSVRSWGQNGVNLTAIVTRTPSVRDLRSTLNGSHGIFVSEAALVMDCTANENGGAGIVSGGFSTITRCVAYLNGTNGIWPSAGSVVTECTSGANGGSGIIAARASTVTNNSCTGNEGHGIWATTYCYVANNTCNSNGFGAASTGHGINISGDNNRIEGNHCSSSDTGIRVDGARNSIFRNTCSGNSVDWIIAVNNIYGAIVDRRAPASTFVNGFAAPSTMGSTDPYANFSY